MADEVGLPTSMPESPGAGSPTAPVAPTAPAAPGVLHSLAGQEQAVAELRAALTAPVHAYLFVGPPGSGKKAAAQAFAAGVLCASGGCATCDVCARVTSGAHPDVVLVERDGASISVGTAREIRRLALRTPNEGGRKVLTLDEFHLVSREAASTLLKVVEEPPPRTVFVILAEHVPAELVTIASRCVRIEFRALRPEEISALLVTEGIDSSVAALAAAAAGGRLDRARLLAVDAGFASRQDRWRSAPGRLDGTGASVATVVAELIDMLASAAVEPLKARHGVELAELDERVQRTGERGSGRKEIESRHKRELKRLRTDELRFGLSVLSGAYRDAALGSATAGPDCNRHTVGCLEAVDTIQAAADSLEHNPAEALLLQALLLHLPPLAATRAADH